MHDSGRIKTIGALAMVAVTVSTGCSAPEAAGVAIVRDSAGVTIVEHPERMAGVAAWTIAERPEAEIGQLADVDPSHQFTQIRGAVRLSDGRIVVGDWGSKEARYFDSRGNHLRTVGGPGAGPGELRLLYNVDRVRGDTLVVDGWPIGSRYWFDENGDFVRGQILGPSYPGMLGRTLVDGSLILDTYEFGSYGNTLESWAASPTEDDLRPAGVVELVSRDGSRIDTIATIRGETWHKTGRLRQNFAMHALPFSPTGLVAWSRDLIFVGHTESPEIRAFGLDGTLRKIVRWVPRAVPVTQADRAWFRTDVLANVRRPPQEPAYRRWLSEISYPEEWPSFSAMIADEEGLLWVRESVSVEADVARWTVFGRDGTATATVDVPADLEVLDVDSTHLVAKWTNELDVEFVRVYRLNR